MEKPKLVHSSYVPGVTPAAWNIKKSLSQISCVECWVSLIISGIEEQSIHYRPESIDWIIFLRSSLSDETATHSFIIPDLASVRAGQKRRRCSREPMCWPEQPGRRHSPDLFLVQWRETWSVTYLSDSILACVTALWISKEFEPQVCRPERVWPGEFPNNQLLLFDGILVHFLCLWTVDKGNLGPKIVLETEFPNLEKPRP